MQVVPLFRFGVGASSQVLCVLRVQAEVCACVCFLCVCWGWGVHQSATCSQSCGPALTLWITEQAAHEEHTHIHTDGHIPGPGPAVHFGWHKRGFISHAEWHIDNIMTTGQSEDVTHAWWNKGMEENALWFSHAGRTRCWSRLECWWIADHCFNSHRNVTDIFDLVLTEGDNRNSLSSFSHHTAAHRFQTTLKWLSIVTWLILKGLIWLHFCVCVCINVDEVRQQYAFEVFLFLARLLALFDL